MPVDKPVGWTSHDVVDRVRRRLGIKKVGHTGTLDPMATGVLVLCLGQATRLSPFLTDLGKSYRAEIHLGVSTDTLDAEGKVTDRSDHIPKDPEEIFRAVRIFVGEVEQIPPMFSARKVSGKRLYRLARSGQEVEREARRVHIYRIDIQGYVPPILEVEVHCSKGTYIRSLADDIGKELGCGGHLAGLRRTAVGNIELSHCIGLERLESISTKEDLEGHLILPNRALSQMPGLCLTSLQVRRFVHGNAVSDVRTERQLEPGGLVRALDACGSLLGIGRWAGEGAALQPVRVFRQQEN